jgi:hypothetical protein
LRRFLRQAGIAKSFLSTWTQEESKRDFLDRLFAKLSISGYSEVAIKEASGRCAVFTVCMGAPI